MHQRDGYTVRCLPQGIHMCAGEQQYYLGGFPRDVQAFPYRGCFAISDTSKKKLVPTAHFMYLCDRFPVTHIRCCPYRST